MKREGAILLSGGMDSIAISYWKKPKYAITIDYGQLPAEGEIRAASIVAKQLGMLHEIIRIDCKQLGSGDMVGTKPSINAPISEWWPYRNQLLVTFGLMAAIKHEVDELMIGCVKSDSVHMDGTSAFIEQLSSLSSLQEGHICVTAPAIDMTTAELVKTSRIPAGQLLWAHSCHKAAVACGGCHGCFKYMHALQSLGLADYASVTNT